MKRILLIIALLFIIKHTHSQCAGNYKNNFGAKDCNSSIFGYNTYIDSISQNQIVIRNFYNIPNSVNQNKEDTIIANIDCLTDSIFLIPISYNVSGGQLSWSGSGKLYADSVKVDYTYTNPNGTTQFCITYVEGVVVSIKENLLKPDQIKIWPNPTQGVLNITTDVQKIQYLSIVDLNGKKRFEIRNSNKTIDISNFSEGLYVLKILTQDGQMITEKLVKQ